MKYDIIDAAGPLQLCAGQDAAAVHCIRQLYGDNNTEALLLVDATNAFNSLNREVALRNSLHLCPSLGRVLTNVYREDASLFIDGEVFRSAEGTTQGDPMAMSMYAVGISPLIQRLSAVNDAKQIWYADDCTGCGTLQDLSQWWLSLTELGPQHGYFPNASKTILLVKEKWLNTCFRTVTFLLSLKVPVYLALP